MKNDQKFPLGWTVRRCKGGTGGWLREYTEGGAREVGCECYWLPIAIVASREDQKGLEIMRYYRAESGDKLIPKPRLLWQKSSREICIKPLLSRDDLASSCATRAVSQHQIFGRPVISGHKYLELRMSNSESFRRQMARVESIICFTTAWNFYYNGL